MRTAFNQLQVAKMKLYNIFFTVPVVQRMMYIAHSRQLRQQGGKEDKRNKVAQGEKVMTCLVIN